MIKRKSPYDSLKIGKKNMGPMSLIVLVLVGIYPSMSDVAACWVFQEASLLREEYLTKAWPIYIFCFSP